ARPVVGGIGSRLRCGFSQVSERGSASAADYRRACLRIHCVDADSDGAGAAGRQEPSRVAHENRLVRRGMGVPHGSLGAVGGDGLAGGTSVQPIDSPQFISVHIADKAGSLVLLAWGLTLRKNPAAHKRLMILATVPLAGDPGFSRFSGWFWPTEPTSHVVSFVWTSPAIAFWC